MTSSALSANPVAAVRGAPGTLGVPGALGSTLRRTRMEFYSWYFLRVSGLLLVFLAMGHFLIMHAFNSILDVDYQFVARRWALPLWRIYDWFLLALALLHGFNGLRVVINEHVPAGTMRRGALWFAASLLVVFLALGTFVLVAFRAPAPS